LIDETQKGNREIATESKSTMKKEEKQKTKL